MFEYQQIGEPDRWLGSQGFAGTTYDFGVLQNEALMI
jgi:hypothetical protein